MCCVPPPAQRTRFDHDLSSSPRMGDSRQRDHARSDFPRSARAFSPAPARSRRRRHCRPRVRRRRRSHRRRCIRPSATMPTSSIATSRRKRSISTTTISTSSGPASTVDADPLKTRPWTVKLDGMVEKEQTIDIDELIKSIGARGAALPPSLRRGLVDGDPLDRLSAARAGRDGEAAGFGEIRPLRDLPRQEESRRASGRSCPGPTSRA